MSHESLCTKAKEAIDRVFSDRSVSQAETARSLNDIVAHCDVLLDCLDEDEYEEDDDDDERKG